MNYLIRDCNKCEFYSVESRVCKKQNTKVYHRGLNPITPAYLNNCPLVSYREKELSMEQAKLFKEENYELY